MRKKYFVIRILNLILVLALIQSYQMISEQRAAKEAAAINKAKKETAASREAAESKAAAGKADYAAESPYKDGSYEGSAEGYGGQVTMNVVIKQGTIKEINTVSAKGEDASYWNMAKGLIPQIVENQDPNVDAVSGATYSSDGITNAVKKALQKAVK